MHDSENMRKITDSRSKMYERVTNQSKTNQDEFPLLIRTLFILSSASRTKILCTQQQPLYRLLITRWKRKWEKKENGKFNNKPTQIEFMPFFCESIVCITIFISLQIHPQHNQRDSRMKFIEMDVSKWWFPYISGVTRYKLYQISPRN